MTTVEEEERKRLTAKTKHSRSEGPVTWPEKITSFRLVCVKMSDNESSWSDQTEQSVEQEAAENPSSLPSQERDEGDGSEVAPTRKTRRRPEQKPQAEELEAPEALQMTEGVSDGGWGYWGSWGKSLISTATATVATVGQGLTQVIEKAESSLGIPSPEELSAQDEEEKTDDVTTGDAKRDEGEQMFGMGGAMGMISSSSMGMLSSLTTAVQSTVLREAKEREEQQKAENVSSETEKKAHYGMLFDEFQGLSHLEALEILSRESETKVKSVLTTLSGEELDKLREDLQDIREPFSLMEFDDEGEDDTKADKLTKARRNAFNHITNMKPPGQNQQEEGKDEEQETPVTTCSIEEAHLAAITSLAEFTARSIEQFHKTAEMLLHCKPEDATTAEQAKVLAQVTIVVCKELSLLSKKFTSCLTTIGAHEKGDVLNPLITSIFLEVRLKQCIIHPGCLPAPHASAGSLSYSEDTGIMTLD
ncbi:hypothetical protein DNTS_033267 [Danionella cerebrum]|uniref:Family with sequence similarity 114 member A2 n=1 Tax=Danionella cerebrum TaxID=2873325 RepID=A0A553RL39_9TELE|nr:hypothetical protein DNTS_033267 [Danionella translucida]